VPVTCIVVAAGASKRLGRPKQLIDYHGEPLVVHAARVALAVAPTIVVVPSHALGVRWLDSALGSERGVEPPHSEGYALMIVENPDAAEGMASSIRHGVGATTGDVVITLCDQPHVTSDHLRALIGAAAPIAATGYSGIAGVPAFFSAEFRHELLALRGDTGARQIIEAHRSRAVVIPFEAARFDVDTSDAISL
jgi:molybdenum cofactor cytidylyltransferase